MAATKEDLKRNISPGSIPYGQRQGLENNISQLQTPASPTAAAAQASGGLGIPSNPLDPLLGGELSKGPGEMTAGLSVGPGPGPMEERVPDGRVERLRLIALTAESPLLREMARRSLRSTVRGRRHAG